MEKGSIMKAYRTLPGSPGSWQCIKSVLMPACFLALLGLYSLPVGDALAADGPEAVNAKGTKQEESAPAMVSASVRHLDQGIAAFRRGAFADAIASFENAGRLFEQEENTAKQCEA